jgi:hypothetical protein
MKSSAKATSEQLALAKFGGGLELHAWRGSEKNQCRRRQKMRTLWLAATTAGMLLWTGPALTQDAAGPSCGSFVVTPQVDDIDFVDEGARGKSPGDFRLVESDLMIDGNRVGKSYITGTLVPSDSGDVMTGTAIAKFPNGTIVSIGMAHACNPQDEAHYQEGEIVAAVVGGTGAFANAKGTVTAKTSKDGKRKTVYDIHCD